MHGVTHAVIFGGILTYLRLDWHRFLWTKRSFQWHIHIFSGQPPKCVGMSFMMWPCHFLILKNVVDSINLEQKDMFVVVVAVDAAKLPLLQRRSRLKQDWIWGLKSRFFLREFLFRWVTEFSSCKDYCWRSIDIKLSNVQNPVMTFHEILIGSRRNPYNGSSHN